MPEAVDDRMQDPVDPAADWPADGGYAVHRGRGRAPWLLPALIVALAVLVLAAAVAAAVLLLPA